MPESRAGLPPGLREQLDAALGVDAGAAGPDAAALARVRQRVMAGVRAQAGALITVPGGPEGWSCAGEGVQVKLLWAEGGMQSVLVRLGPGARFPGHGHEKAEECVVLEGELRIGPAVQLRRGDYHRAMPGAQHEEAVSEHGALVFLRGPA